MGGISLIIDTSLLLLYVVGLTDRTLVEKHKRLDKFTVDDFDLLCRLIATAPEVLVTPNVLTETSNLLKHISEPAKSRIYEKFRSVILSTPEQYVQSSIACKDRDFLRLRLTDSGLMAIADKSRAILTTDLDLYHAACARGLSAVNFNHIREQFSLRI